MMGDPPVLQPSAAHLAPRGRQFSPTSDPPSRQRQPDDLLSRLTPRTAVDVFRNPSGALKVCMDASTQSEQSFALRAATASKNIQEWLEELSAWPWPEQDSSAGFERPPPKRRKLFHDIMKLATEEEEEEELEGQLSDGKIYLGSLLATEVSRYECRIDDISRDMEDLDVEEIKTHVLHNHIMPLSRPGTPMSDSNRSVMSSLAAYAHMDDLTALITATIIQALPNLSRLTRLMNTWSIRLAVLRKSSSFLPGLAEAEAALRSGWNAMDLGAKSDAGEGTSDSALSRSDFNVMKLVLERKVSKAGQHLDYMLDTLEGREDTLPEAWIDRMDALEREYGEWVAACERRIRESEWAKMVRENRAARAASPGGEDEVPAPARDQLEDVGGLLSGHGILADTGAKLQNDDSGAAASVATTSTEVVIKIHPAEATEDTATYSRQPDQNDAEVDGEDTLATTDQVVDTSPALDTATGQLVIDENALVLSKEAEEADPTLANARLSPTETSPESSDIQLQGSESWVVTGGSDTSTEQSVAGEKNLTPPETDEDFDPLFDMLPDIVVPEPELPTLPRTRRGSDVSNTSTIIHGPQSGFMDFPSDPPDHGTPEFPRLRNVVAEPALSDGMSPPSSPPNFRSSTRSLSVSFNDIPTVVEVPNDEETPPRTPMMDYSAFDDEDLTRGVESPASPTSPSKMSTASADDQLQQQISDILQSIPAKIKLTTRPSEVNLNPPDFMMPSRSKPKADPIPRGHSSRSNLSSRASSRAGTPSFTLAPAYTRNPRPRIQRGGNQDIKLYHLSRSNGEAPIKLFIRCVGENGERVMVRVGGGWADLGEYLKEYATHHRRSGGEGKVEIRDLPRVVAAAAASSRAGSSPPSRPASAMDASSPITPLNVRKTRKSMGEEGAIKLPKTPLPKTPLANTTTTAAAGAQQGSSNNTPSSGASTRSRSSSRLSWTEEDSSLGMAGPKGKNVEMSEESKAWVESVKEKVRIASGERRVSDQVSEGRFGDMGKVGGTKRLFRRQGG